jgi:hypothetical protein
MEEERPIRLRQEITSKISTLVFHSLFNHSRTSTKKNGFQCVVLGRTVCVKVWKHYFIGDTKGNNKWLGQYPGNREGVRRPYCDCKCQFHDLSNPNPNCICHSPYGHKLFSGTGTAQMGNFYGDPHMVMGIPVWKYFLYGDFYPTLHMGTNSFLGWVSD